MPGYGIYANMSKEALLFPGQGIKPNIIRKFYADLDREAPGITHKTLALTQEVMNKIHGSKAYSIQDILTGEAMNLFKKTEVYQPVVCSLSLAGYKYSRERECLSPAYVAGHSMGEWTALIIAGGITEAEGLEAVAWRGLFMQQAAEQTESGLVSISGLNQKQIEDLCHKLKGKLQTRIALKNAPAAFVLGCAAEGIPLLKEEAHKAEAIAVKSLDVAAAFHTPSMEEAAKNFKKQLPHYTFNRLTIPVVANLTGKAVEQGEIYPLDYLIYSMTQPVLWAEIMAFLKANAVKSYREEGPGATLKYLCSFNGIDKSKITGTFGKFF